MQSAKTNGYTLSFVIRTYNEAAFIGRLLKILQDQQNVAGEREVVIVDSGSTDDTIQIAQRWPVKLVSLRKEEFHYSKALNLGIEHSSGDLIVILSAHSIPCDTEWLSRMISHFKNPKVAGVYSRQIPWPDANWREVRRIRGTFGDETLVQDHNDANTGITFSNAASSIRRSLWEKRPFVLPIAEDTDWAAWAITSGYQIVYEASVSVYHSHNDTCRQAARRAIEFEKGNDSKRNRSRTLSLTARQAAGRAYRDLRYVLSLREPWSRRLRLTWDCFANAYWFLREFNR